MLYEQSTIGPIIMSFNETKEILKKTLINQRSEIIDYLKSLSESQFGIKMNAENNESWTVLEVVKHLYNAEDGMTKLIQGIKEGGKGVSDDFDLKRYNMHRVNKLKEIESFPELLSMLNKSRERLLLLLETLDEEDFAKKGRHAIGKILTIEQIFNLCWNHEKQHLEKCKSVLN